MSSSLPETYPIEIEFPDIRPYAEGNTGVPYVFSFDSGKPGPHVMINALTHGNEVCGAIAVKGLLDHGIKPRSGKLTLAFANVEAYQSFDPENPDASRFVDQDFNRIWKDELLDDSSRDSSELRRARLMRPIIDTVDLLLDLHSMHEKSAPLNLSGPLDKGIQLAAKVGTPPTIIIDAGHAEGCRLRDYADFANPYSEKNALLIECGQHWEAGAVNVAHQVTAHFLVKSGIVETVDLPDGWLRPELRPPQAVRVTEGVVADNMNFRFSGPYQGLETFKQQGTIIGWQDDTPITTPYPNCVLVMPSLRQLRSGVTVVRFGQLEDIS